MTETWQASTDNKVTMAVLSNKIDNLDNKFDEHSVQQDRLWDTHVVLHREQEKRMRFLEQNCHPTGPHEQQLQELKTEQAVLKHRVGVVGGLNALATAAGTALATFLGRSS